MVYIDTLLDEITCRRKEPRKLAGSRCLFDVKASLLERLRTADNSIELEKLDRLPEVKSII